MLICGENSLALSSLEDAVACDDVQIALLGLACPSDPNSSSGSSSMRSSAAARIRRLPALNTHFAS